jgi:hypothetical protein
VDEGALGVHEVELVVEPGPRLHDGGGVGEAAHRALHAGQVAARHYSGRLVVDAHLWEEDEGSTYRDMATRFFEPLWALVVDAHLWEEDDPLT